MWRSERRWGVWARAALLAALPGTGGCVEVAIQEAHQPFDYAAAPRPVAAAPSEGAIWPGEHPSGSFLFFDQKARGVGDLVTVLVVENVSAEGEATTDVESQSTLSTKLTSDVGFQELVSAPVRWLLRTVGLDDPGRDVPSGSELNVIESDSQNTFEGEGSTRRAGRFNAVITCRVVDELPGGVFHIRGRRAIVVNHELQFLTVEGLVRREENGIENRVSSAALAEARITLDGLGVIDDRQRPGLLARALAWLYPF